MERLDLFRAQTGNGKQFEDRSRKFRAQFVEKFQRTGFRQLLDLGRDRFADAGNFLQRLFVSQSPRLPPQVSIERAAFV